MTKKRYDNLDGLRAYAAIGIVMMHILANGAYVVSGFVFEKLIPSFTNFTFLFMIVSAFSMCCGYYERFRNGSIDLDQFYKRRYQKIWPYFAALCTLALILSFSVKSVYEYLADLTLAFGLIPDNGIEIIGVGWFLGVVFVFYMVFPFFTFLIGNKKRAWFSFIVCLTLNWLCIVRFEEVASRGAFIYSAMFFMAGGLIYLYRDELRGKTVSVISGVALAILLILLYTGHSLPGEYMHLLIFSALLIFTISVRTNPFFSNRISKFLSSISMEIYLSHMIIYRLFERLHMTKLVGGGTASYFLTVAFVLIGAIIFSVLLKRILSFIEGFLLKGKAQA